MTVSGRRYELDSRGVQSALEGVLPEPIHEHFAVINGRRWPPKQVLALVTGWIAPISPLTRPAGP